MVRLLQRFRSIIAKSDNTGAKTATFTYSPFGEPNPSSLSGTTFGYTGQRYDSETNLYHYKARFYSATIGRFLQPDPMGHDGGDLNLYAYVENDPLNHTDPNGTYKDKNDFHSDPQKLAKMGIDFWKMASLDLPIGIAKAPGAGRVLSTSTQGVRSTVEEAGTGTIANGLHRLATAIAESFERAVRRSSEAPGSVYVIYDATPGKAKGDPNIFKVGEAFTDIVDTRMTNSMRALKVLHPDKTFVGKVESNWPTKTEARQHQTNLIKSYGKVFQSETGRPLGNRNNN